MLVLGIETSTTTGSVALLTAERLLAQYTLNIEVTHSERLMAAVDRVLSDARMAMNEIGGFAVSIGPGSFTGLRVGLATVKGLAFATGKPVAAVPTLRALAWNLPFASQQVCPVMDARKNEVYAALFRFEGPELVQLMDEAVLPLSQLAERITEPTIFTGEAARLYRGEIERILGKKALFAPLSSDLPSAASVAALGLNMIGSGDVADPDALTPMYIRRPEAEVAWERKQRSR